MSTLSHASNVEKPSIGSIIKNGAIAGGIGAVVNAVLFFLGRAMGSFSETILSPAGQPITVVAVIMVTLIGAVAGIIGYIVLTRFLSKSRADLTFLILASLVLVGMAITPLQLPGADVLMIVLLQVMHVVIGVALMYYLPKSV